MFFRCSSSSLVLLDTRLVTCKTRWKRLWVERFSITPLDFGSIFDNSWRKGLRVERLGIPLRALGSVTRDAWRNGLWVQPLGNPLLSLRLLLEVYTSLVSIAVPEAAPIANATPGKSVLEASFGKTVEFKAITASYAGLYAINYIVSALGFPTSMGKAACPMSQIVDETAENLTKCAEIRKLRRT